MRVKAGQAKRLDETTDVDHKASFHYHAPIDGVSGTPVEAKIAELLTAKISGLPVRPV